MRWELRQATARDADRLYEIHRAAMHDHVEAVWGWDETDQRSRFRTGFDPACVSVIMVAAKPVGLLRVDHRNDEVFLASVEFAPEVQRGGLGSAIICWVLREAAQRSVPYVSKSSGRIRRGGSMRGFASTSLERPPHTLRWCMNRGR